MEIEDLSTKVYAPELHQGVVTRSVGWLGCRVPVTGGYPTSITH